MREKKSAELEMGYCPFEHWLGRTRWVGAHGARARGWALGCWAQAGAGARPRGAPRTRGRARCAAHGRARCAACGRSDWGVRQAGRGTRGRGARGGCKRTAYAHLGVLAGL